MSLNVADLRRNAEAGSCNSQSILGACHLYAYEVDRDCEEAFRWLSAAAAQGSSRAVLNLAYMHAEGLGISQELPEAVRLFIAVAKPDDSSDALAARIQLGRIFSQGQGMAINADEARKWYQAAIDIADEYQHSEELKEAKAYIGVRGNLI